ncbi:MAG TPA: serine/threonine-protein kinase [Candidatus Acidoferrum sp.]|nr:serine/threonine-protein kinase [Candidatus Acidoferrum sp.]
MYCSECGSAVPETAKFCAACGTGVAESDPGATIAGAEGETLAPKNAPRARSGATPPRTPKAASNPSGVLSSSDAIGGGRFAPGTVLEGRYRIVALAGRGGMGEVYRAEDLKLTQTVAIKFLPESLSRDAAALQRFHSEVRIARQVSHPNVCRVFDVGEFDGITFLTMEFVDGEDLASLLRRIGRLPQDKAIEVARQICAGLAAAHDKGVIHRDLKPANIMLDGLGKVRINDFGLAGIAANMQGADVRAGTPAYMAPEQLTGTEVTSKSDIYALGLVLYEILTGKRAFEAATLPELIRKRNQLEITKPSELVRDLDPILEQLILRCLNRDAANRPSSALQVAAALPGGDPLAAALAAGETPSPQMVAAAGENTGLSPRVVLAAIGAMLLGTLLVLYIGVKENGLETLRPNKPPEVLAHQAREILDKLGYPERPGDWAGEFDYNYGLLSYLTKPGNPRPDWKRMLLQRPMMLEFWYRQSSTELVPLDWHSTLLTPGIVDSSDPPPIQPGMINMWMDGEGRLQWLQAIPPEVEPGALSALGTQGQSKAPAAASAAERPPDPDWSALFAAAGIDASQLRPATPKWLSLAAFDTRVAWDGTWPQSGYPLHVEAAAWRGRTVFFSLTGPWSRPNRTPNDLDKEANIGNLIALIVSLLTLAGGVWFAIRNLARGRGDRASAWRLACIVFGIGIATFVLEAHFVASLSMLLLVLLAMSTSLFLAGTLWVLYIALEPYVRRNWPQTIISWTRLMSGRFRDPLVGRDLVSGVVMGMCWILVFEIGLLFRMRAGGAPQFAGQNYLMGMREAAGTFLSNVVTSILGTLLFFFALVLLRVLVRNAWLAAALFTALFTIPKVLGSDHLVADILVWTTIYAIAAVAVVRFGLVVLGIASLLANVLLNLPFTLDFSNWYATQCFFIVLLFVAIGVWGGYTSLGGKPIFGKSILED